jgi:hypothetical protein
MSLAPLLTGITYCESFETKQALLTATREFFKRYHQHSAKVLSIIGSLAIEITYPTEIA